MAPATLSRQLSRRTTLIVAVLAVLLSLGMMLTVRLIIYSQVDDQLDNALQRQEVGRGGSPGPGIRQPGMPIGTIVVIQAADGSAVGLELIEGGAEALSDEAAHTIFEVDPDSGKHTVHITGMGDYRVEVRSSEASIVAVALPLSDANSALYWLAILAGGLTVVAVAGAALATRAASTAATAPLRRLSSTAAEMSRLDLGTGTVSLPEPVPTDDLPPEHEVAQLTGAFNLMLGNVQNALAVRQSSETKLRRFVADASHELRNPLAAIRGYTELAQHAGEEDQRFALGRIDAESGRMTKLVNDLLLLARLDAETPPRLRPVDVVEVALNAVSDAQAAGAEHTWRLQLPESVIEVLADPDQLHQVVVNLLSNARAHTPPGTTVVTAVAAQNGYCRLTVTDDGPGISPEILPHVFERFSRADTMRAHTEHRSTGLGLAIVEAVVSSFGGRATVTSRPGHTEFAILLPLVPSPEPGAPIQQG